MSYDLNRRNQQLIDAVRLRAQQRCPGSLALIGVYGSFATGEATIRSDLDLMIVIHDDAGYQLSCCFIQDDLSVGHDLYCTTWASLEEAATQYTPALPKLLDAQIVYCDGDGSLARLQQLQAHARSWLAAPYDAHDLQQSETLYQALCSAYTGLMTADAPAWTHAAELQYRLEHLLAQLHKAYFRRSSRYRLEELAHLPELPPGTLAQLDALCRARTLSAQQAAATALVRGVQELLQRRRQAVQRKPQPATAAALRGSLEECVSNWRGKAWIAAETGNAYLSLSALGGFQQLLDEVASDVDIGHYDVLGGYHPSDLRANAAHYDTVLTQFAAEYHRVRLPVRHYADIDAMIADYTKP